MDIAAPANQRSIALVAMARSTADRAGYIGPGMTHRLCDEIERLQCLLTKSAEMHGWGGIEGLLKQRNEAMDERDRLRAALEQIRDGDWAGQWASRLACDALAHEPSETP